MNMIINLSIKSDYNLHIVDQSFVKLDWISLFISNDFWLNLTESIFLPIVGKSRILCRPFFHSHALLQKLNSSHYWAINLTPRDPATSQLFLCFLYILVQLLKRIRSRCSMMIKLLLGGFKAMCQIFDISPRSESFSPLNFILYIKIVREVLVI